MDLLQSFKDFIVKEQLFSEKDRLLVAVSGGMDSVVLCQLCHLSNLDFVIAHCNFQLRGDESMRDEVFVRQLAAKYNRQCLVRRMDTLTYATEQGLSIQVAARNLRYNWFREITGHPSHSNLSDHPNLSHAPSHPGHPRDPNHPRDTSLSSASSHQSASASPDLVPAPRWILTAHHLDDNIETLLMNFFKGTGIAGLRGILPRQGNIVRPLLFAEKEILKKFAEQHGLSWVEDSSNATDKYTRNYFRHQVIPLVQQRLPEASHNLADNLSRFRDIETLYRQSVEQHKKKLLEIKGNEVHIPVLKLKKTQPLHTIVYEIITGFGFSPQQVSGVIDLLDSESGRYIKSSTHRILKDRKWLIISAHPAAQTQHILIESPEDKIVYENGSLRLELFNIPSPPRDASNPTSAAPKAQPESNPEPEPKPGRPSSSQASSSSASVKISPDPLVAQLDATAIQFPLLLRKWRPGDYFYPLGLGKKKKLARFFIDCKLSLADKEKIWVLEMNKKIIWVIGLRIDHRFRITPQTHRILKIESGMA